MAKQIKPINASASAYFDRLSEILLTIQVTDSDGDDISLDQGASSAVGLLQKTKSIGGKVMVIGNGGSAAIASHMHNDLCKAVGLRALVFNEAPLLMALANDHDYSTVFERPVALWAGSDDLLLAISSSGQSENILKAVRMAGQHGCNVITLSGFQPDNPLRQMGQVNFYVSAAVYGYVELAHSILAHFLTDSLIAQNGA